MLHTKRIDLYDVLASIFLCTCLFVRVRYPECFENSIEHSPPMYTLYEYIVHKIGPGSNFGISPYSFPKKTVYSIVYSTFLFIHIDFTEKKYLTFLRHNIIFNAVVSYIMIFEKFILFY